MLAKKITYKDFNGNERTETFYFNLSETEISKSYLLAEGSGGIDEKLRSIAESNDRQKIIDTFESLILDSYGVKSEDGKHFRKSKALSEEFKSTPAYDKMFMEFLTDTEAAVNFINGIIPKEVSDRMKEYKEAERNNITVS